MSVFEDFNLKWDGKDYVIPSDRIMGVIARVEDVITLYELATLNDPRKIKLSHLAQAYGTVLRYAGCKVKDDDVYGTLFGDQDASANAQRVVLGLLVLMTPPSIGKEEARKAGVTNP